jgi:hypothetical protein
MKQSVSSNKKKTKRKTVLNDEWKEQHILWLPAVAEGEQWR